ncbi:MAG: aldo/keto reductase [Gammaproteobacteria bacterium]|nr:aldo/keto reductase [Pseudomonadales bacterium]MCP5349100.1 aldo/keto reductase [Pseudomonadales bacterium]
MELRTLGRTGLQVSVAGFGGGGLSCLGLKQGKAEKEIIQLLNKGLDAGINLLDTSERNGTEPAIGKALKNRARDKIILSSKRSVSYGEHQVSSAEFSKAIDDSLRALGVDYIDIFSFHGVFPGEYDRVVQELLPSLTQAKAAGKVRFCGITEAFKSDTRHQMLQTALMDDLWDVIMVGYNVFNFSAQELLFDQVNQNNIGVLGMFAVRQALRDEDNFLETVRKLIESGELNGHFDEESILNQLLNECEERLSVAELAYRYCLGNPSIHSVLMGTGNPLHLEQNLGAFNKSTLSPIKIQLIEKHFGGIQTVSGQRVTSE